MMVARSLSQRPAAGPSPPSNHDNSGVWAVSLGVIAAVIHAITLLSHPFGVVDLGIQVVLMLILFPWFFARRLFIPLGWVRPAYVMGWAAMIRFRVDRKGGAALAAAWALCHRRKAAPALAAFVERRLERCKPVRGAAVTAAGLLCAARGDHDGARQLLGSVAWMAATVCPHAAAGYANEWLAVDAASEGRWHKVLELARGGNRSAMTMFLAAAAARLLGQSTSRAPLIWRWLWAHDRLETWSLLRRAWAMAPATPEVSPAEPPAIDGSEAERALAAHAVLLARGPRLVDVVAVARRWDEALDSASLRRRAAERALSLAAPSGEAALQSMRSAVEADLAAALAGGDGLLPSLGSGVLGRAVSQVRNQLLTEVESLSSELRQRAVDKRALRGIDEWRELVALRVACDRALRRGGTELLRLGFAKVHPDACKLAVWLWNERRERALAHAVFRWLHDLAVAVEDAEAEALQSKNLACGSL